MRIRFRLPRLLASEPLDTLVQDLGRSSPSSALGFDDTLSVIRVAEAFLARCPGVANTCLYRALGRFAVLRAEGLSVEVVIGMRDDGSHEKGHAWILVDGVAFDEDDAHEASQMTITFRSSSSEQVG